LFGTFLHEKLYAPSKEILMLSKAVLENRGHIANNSRIIKVASTSRSTAVAGAIAGVLRATPTAEIQAIGAAAVNQAMKALAIARSYLKDDEIDFLCAVEFIDLNIDGRECTAIRFSLEVRAIST
jgi:stage V sporulation protein S